jgi:hypothetical protein
MAAQGSRAKKDQPICRVVHANGVAGFVVQDGRRSGDANAQ